MKTLDVGQSADAGAQIAPAAPVEATVPLDVFRALAKATQFEWALNNIFGSQLRLITEMRLTGELREEPVRRAYEAHRTLFSDDRSNFELWLGWLREVVGFIETSPAGRYSLTQHVRDFLTHIDTVYRNGVPLRLG